MVVVVLGHTPCLRCAEVLGVITGMYIGVWLWGMLGVNEPARGRERFGLALPLGCGLHLIYSISGSGCG